MQLIQAAADEVFAEAIASGAPITPQVNFDEETEKVQAAAPVLASACAEPEANKEHSLSSQSVDASTQEDRPSIERRPSSLPEPTAAQQARRAIEQEMAQAAMAALQRKPSNSIFVKGMSIRPKNLQRITSWKRRTSEKRSSPLKVAAEWL